MLEPEIKQPRRGGRLDVAQRIETANVIDSQALPVKLIARRMKGQTFPAGEFFEISINVELQKTLVDRAALEPANRIAQNFTDVIDAVSNAVAGKRGAHWDFREKCGNGILRYARQRRHFSARGRTDQKNACADEQQPQFPSRAQALADPVS